jgi:hypothetical protein
MTWTPLRRPQAGPAEPLVLDLGPYRGRCRKMEGLEDATNPFTRKLNRPATRMRPNT